MRQPLPRPRANAKMAARRERKLLRRARWLYTHDQVFRAAFDEATAQLRRQITDELNRAVYGDPAAPAREFVGLDALLDPDSEWPEFWRTTVEPASKPIYEHELGTP